MFRITAQTHYLNNPQFNLHDMIQGIDWVSALKNGFEYIEDLSVETLSAAIDLVYSLGKYHMDVACSNCSGEVVLLNVYDKDETRLLTSYWYDSQKTRANVQFVLNAEVNGWEAIKTLFEKDNVWTEFFLRENGKEISRQKFVDKYLNKDMQNLHVFYSPVSDQLDHMRVVMYDCDDTIYYYPRERWILG
ncbi:hypothetical protein ABHN03_16925 [Paenibacillus sp. NRS-1775]|uniref:hypothetical protein n=1 Tax=unclassified Paenibacillus TaxID=185978 RepID=UPI003D26C9F6